MASTQNRNTKSDYCLEQGQNTGIFTHITYENAQNGKAYTNMLLRINTAF